MFDKNSSRVWQIGCVLSDGRFEIKKTSDYPVDIFDLAKLKNGKTYELREDGDSVNVVSDQKATSPNGRRVRVGDIVSCDKEMSYTLYRIVRGQVKKITVNDKGQAKVDNFGQEIGRRDPNRYGRRFVDLASLGENVFLVEPRSRSLRRVSESGNSLVPKGSFAWFPIAVVNFADQLLIAEIPRAGIRWLLRHWKPVRVRRIDLVNAQKVDAVPASVAGGSIDHGNSDIPLKTLTAGSEP